MKHTAAVLLLALANKEINEKNINEVLNSVGIKANQNVSWSTKCEDSYYGSCTYVGKSSSTSTVFKGTLAATFTNSDGTTTSGPGYSNTTAVTFYTKAGQAIVLTIKAEIA